MEKIKIFLAYTEEVKDDSKEIKSAILTKYQEKNSVIVKDWTDEDKGFEAEKRFQDRLNKVIGTCDILYIFFKNKIGEYTKEEFNYGLERLKEYKKPYCMSLFFKEFKTSNKASEIERIQAKDTIEFQDKVREINGNQYTVDYTNIDDLKNKLLAQLEIDIKKVIELQKNHKNNPSHSLIKFEGTCREDIIPIAVKVLKRIDDYIEKNVCFPCIHVQYDSLRNKLLEKFEDEALQLSIKYLLSNSCIVFLKKEDYNAPQKLDQ